MATGEPDALRDLYDLLVDRIHGIVVRILRDPEDVQEAIQDTFVKAWQKAATYRPERGEVISWLVLIARSSAIDRVRQGARRQAALQSMQTQPDAAEAIAFSVADGREFLDLHLSHLSAPQRTALELAFFTGCTQAEIALRMQTPLGNVKNHLRRGLLKLRQLSDRYD
jgi:RNA polymerase sigma-70 factor (ECF subfamily)